MRLFARGWYAAAAAAVRHGWTRDVLPYQIATAFHDRAAAVGSNFAQALERTDSEPAQQITKDPYILDFLALDGEASERVLEQGLVDRIINTFHELGAGFAFVGRQVHFDVDGDGFYIDLLLFHTEQVRYVVVEIKTGKFKPEHYGQLTSKLRLWMSGCVVSNTRTPSVSSFAPTRTPPS
jgi:predicted nuclease of restriction endonuclease-like (RecB) superfamily